MLTRRRFLSTSIRGLAATGVAPWLAACARTPSVARATIDLSTVRIAAISERRNAPGYAPGSASFLGHLGRVGDGSSGIGAAGIDYAPHRGPEPTLICPVARGVVIGHLDGHVVSGMKLVIAHGLGWKSEYAHLDRRFVGYRTNPRVERRDVIAVMGASGTGAARGGTMGPLRHVHLNLIAPEFAPLLRGLLTQDWPTATPGFRYLVDAEDFSIAGPAARLPYGRPTDDAYDDAFVAKHDEAVRFCDVVLDRLADDEAWNAKKRSPWERELRFDYAVDLRIWYLWQRLASGKHTFTAVEVEEYRATLTGFMQTVPRLTAPIVEAERRDEYRTLRETPLAVFQGPGDFGARPR